jgi:hypothetical protein
MDLYCMFMYLVSIFPTYTFDLSGVHLHKIWIFSSYLKENKIHPFPVIYWLILVWEIVVFVFILHSAEAWMLQRAVTDNCTVHCDTSVFLYNNYTCKPTNISHWNNIKKQGEM